MSNSPKVKGEYCSRGRDSERLHTFLSVVVFSLKLNFFFLIFEVTKELDHSSVTQLC